MKRTILSLSILTLGLIITVSCSKDDVTPTNPTGTANPELDITNVIPSSLGSAYTSNFNRYTKVTTPNGGAIHIVAQHLITDEQIVRCRSILQHFLTNLSGSQYGSDKSEIANKMAENVALLLLLNGQDDGSNNIEVHGQPLFQNEIQVEGHSWYMNQNYEHRDAAYEEILHLVHDYGIGVDGANSNPGAAPAYQAEIRAAQQNGLSNNIWAIGVDQAMITEWTNENSLSQEYLASVIDAYYGLWGAWTESSTNSMWGAYAPKVRNEMPDEDPMGYNLMDKFFHSYLTYNARIDASLDGNFSLKFDASKPYTHHSRYLKDITLLGSNNNTVTVNELDNNITGNTGSNTVIFSGTSTEYSLSTSNGVTTVSDNIANRDGTNTLNGIEKLQFTDTTVDL